MLRGEEPRREESASRFLEFNYTWTLKADSSLRGSSPRSIKPLPSETVQRIQSAASARSSGPLQLNKIAFLLYGWNLRVLIILRSLGEFDSTPAFKYNYFNNNVD